jgi:glycosyltransferase involved in cell wall biosynthesis
MKGCGTPSHGIATMPTGSDYSHRDYLMAEKLPLVSIVTPSYNQGRFLKRTIESVLTQTYPHIEYLVIDGGSTDESVDILRSYNSRFRWVSEPDGGQTQAVNKGFASSHGVIRSYLNSDDVLQPDAIAKVVAHFSQHPQCDLLYGRAYNIDENDQIIGLYDTRDYSFDQLGRRCFICQPAAFWQTRIVDKIGPFNERLHYAMDYEYWLRIAGGGGRIEHIHDVLAACRVHAATKTLLGREQVFREIIQVCSAQLGYADVRFFTGLWYCFIHVRKQGWPTYFCWLPRFYQVMGCLHWFFSRSHLLAAKRSDLVNPEWQGLQPTCSPVFPGGPGK